MKKKGQAAMEFLMTYGWAILVVLAAIGALAYFGVLSPKNILPSSCTVGAGFGCRDTKATDGTVTFTLLNNLGNDLDHLNIEFVGDVADEGCVVNLANEQLWKSGDDVGIDGDCAVNCSVGYDADPSNGVPVIRTGKDMITLVFEDCFGAGTAGTLSGNAVTDFTISYRVTGESLSHQVAGKANLKVET